MCRPGERLSESPLPKSSASPAPRSAPRWPGSSRRACVELIPSGGFAVRSFTRDDVIDAIELRGVLEGHGRTARRRARRAARADARHQGLCCAGWTKPWPTGPRHMDFDRYVELNAEFHDALAGLAGSETIRREIERVTQPALRLAQRLPRQAGGRARVPPLADRRTGAAPRHRQRHRAARRRRGPRRWPASTGGWRGRTSNMSSTKTRA